MSRRPARSSDGTRPPDGPRVDDGAGRGLHSLPARTGTGMTSDREQAIFEAGIKLGALYHQWVGTPISPQTAEVIEEAIEQAVGLQPFVEEITVQLDRSRMRPNEFGYSELSGLMFDVVIVTRHGDATCRARLAPHDDYPLMEVLGCRDAPPVPDHR